jgi:hypothetical protein
VTVEVTVDEAEDVMVDEAELVAVVLAVEIADDVAVLVAVELAVLTAVLEPVLVAVDENVVRSHVRNAWCLNCTSTSFRRLTVLVHCAACTNTSVPAEQTKLNSARSTCASLSLAKVDSASWTASA